MRCSNSLFAILLVVDNRLEIDPKAGNNARYIDEGIENGLLGRGRQDMPVLTAAGEKLARVAMDAIRNHT